MPTLETPKYSQYFVAEFMRDAKQARVSGRIRKERNCSNALWVRLQLIKP
jgi:hypothetical protein